MFDANTATIAIVLIIVGAVAGPTLYQISKIFICVMRKKEASQ